MNNSPREDGFIRVGEYEFSFDRGELTEEFKEIAARELRETPEIREQALRKFKELIKTEKGLNFPTDEDDMYLIFLRPTCFYPDDAMKLARNFFTFKANNPHISRNLVPSANPNPFLQELVTGLPKRDRHNRRVLIINGGAQWDPNTCSVYDLIRGVILLVTMAALEPKSQVTGGVVIIDVEGMGLTHAFQFSPRLASNILTLVQDCMPLHLHAIHILNQPYIFDMVYAIFRPFMSHKLRNMMQLHGTDREALIEDLGIKNLPAKYGGELDFPDIPSSTAYELLCYYENEFREMVPFGYTKKSKKQCDDDFQQFEEGIKIYKEGFQTID